jgi:predicted acylesterase/phospholipase RssA
MMLRSLAQRETIHALMRTITVNAVFKGGGAKGIVYVGALRAAEDHGLVFDSVAGSSAGAITATLAALKLDTKQLEKEAAIGLRKVRDNLWPGFFPWCPKTLYRVGELGQWLEGLIRACVAQHRAANASEATTFEELFEATHVALFVVATDLHTREPIVFSHFTTPKCQVVDAVLASCAIPLAMPPGRVIVRDETGERQVHRLVDGGAWANYPAFVFKDLSFRASAEIEPVETEYPTIGFIIERPRATRADPMHFVGTRSRSDWDFGSGARVGKIGAALNWPVFRTILAVVFPFALVVLLSNWFVHQARGFFPSLGWLGTATFESVAITLIVLVITTFVLLTIALGVVMYRFAYEALDVGLPTLLASVSVGPRVPRWLGKDEGDHVVRLSIPEGISTRSFKADPAKQGAAIAKAYEEADVRLAEIVSALQSKTAGRTT